MASYKQTVLDIKDYISFAVAELDRLLEKPLSSEQRMLVYAEKDTLKDIAAIIKENEK